jgi:hypothetical protein
MGALRDPIEPGRLARVEGNGFSDPSHAPDHPALSPRGASA